MKRTTVGVSGVFFFFLRYNNIIYFIDLDRLKRLSSYKVLFMQELGGRGTVWERERNISC